MKLYLEKRGMDFYDEETRRESDLENYRLFLEFIDRQGRRVCGDIGRMDIRESVWSERSGKRNTRIVSRNGLSAHWQYENYKGCFGYPIDVYGRYKKADVLKLVNSVSAVQYDAVEIVKELPEAAHDYPENVLDLERAYLAADHEALVKSIEDKIRANYTSWHNASDYSFARFTPDEYKRITLIAFRMMVENYGVIECDIKATETRLKLGCLVARRMAKHFFEEQGTIDPYADEAFLKELYNLSPYYVGGYLNIQTPEKFLESIAE